MGAWRALATADPDPAAGVLSHATVYLVGAGERAGIASHAPGGLLGEALLHAQGSVPSVDGFRADFQAPGLHLAAKLEVRRLSIVLGLNRHPPPGDLGRKLFNTRASFSFPSDQKLSHGSACLLCFGQVTPVFYASETHADICLLEVLHRLLPSFCAHPPVDAVVTPPEVTNTGPGF